MPKGKRLTDCLVGAAATVGGLVYIWAYLSWPWATFASTVLLYEVYTLVNDMPEDTISETIWRASDQHALVPLLGAGTFVLSLSEGWITDPHVIVPLGILVGHFWFPRYGNRRSAHRRERQQISQEQPEQSDAA